MLESSIFKIKTGATLSVKFYVKSDLKLERSTLHKLKKDGNDVTRPYKLEKNLIIMENIIPKDEGNYTISCQNEVGEACAFFKLLVITSEGKNVNN